jgi:hypothetical protein
VLTHKCFVSSRGKCYVLTTIVRTIKYFMNVDADIGKVKRGLMSNCSMFTWNLMFVSTNLPPLNASVTGDISVIGRFDLWLSHGYQREHIIPVELIR